LSQRFQPVSILPVFFPQDLGQEQVQHLAHVFCHDPAGALWITPPEGLQDR